MTKLSKIDRELRKQFQQMEQREAREVTLLQQAETTEALLCPQQIEQCFVAFAHHTQRVVTEAFPSTEAKVHVIHPKKAAALRNDKYGLVGGMCLVVMRLPEGALHLTITLETYSKPVRNPANEYECLDRIKSLVPDDLYVHFRSRMLDPETGRAMRNPEMPGCDWVGDGEMEFGCAIDPEQYADYIQSMMPCTYWTDRLFDRLEQHSAVTGWEV